MSRTLVRRAAGVFGILVLASCFDSTGPDELRSLAASLEFDRASELREEYRRVTRRARKVFESRFYD